MKVVVISATDPDDYRQFLGIKVDGKMLLSFCDGEPEDISKLMEMAHEAGKKGEAFEVERIKVEWGDWE